MQSFLVPKSQRDQPFVPKTAEERKQIEEKACGKVRIGRLIIDANNKRTMPSFKGFTPILVLTKSSAYGSLGPYVVKDKQGRIMENLWQGAKVYRTVPATKCTSSRWDDTVIWDHPAEVHMSADGALTPEFFAWRDKLMRNPYPVRYPVGIKHRSECIGVFAETSDGQVDTLHLLGYAEARQKVYVYQYARLVRPQPDFARLQKRLKAGENLLIIETDGPHQESVDHYVKLYGADKDCIVDSTVLATKDNLRMLMADTKHPFGHGYVLAACLLDKEKEWLLADDALPKAASVQQ